MKKIFVIVSFLIITACQDRTVQDTGDDGQDTLELSRTLEVENDRVVTLLPEAQEAINEWLAYATAQNEIQELRNATGHDIVETSEPMVQIMEGLQSTIPPELQETAVRARVNVLVTKARLLHQRANKKYRNEEEIYGAASDLIEEFDNFKIQLNEVFLSTPEDFELELDREFEEGFEDDTLNPAASPLER